MYSFLRPFQRVLLRLTLGLILCSGCQSYTPTPIDWAIETITWTPATTNAIDLTLTVARQCALILNPQINAVRLTQSNARQAARAAGWWNDPTLDFDALRILRGGAHPWISGAGVSFSLPLKGIPGIEKQAATFYAHAAELSVTVAEYELVAEVDQLWNACVIELRHVAAMRHEMKQLNAHEQQLRTLVAIGEYPRDVIDTFVIQRLSHERALSDSISEAEKRQYALRRLLGLHPTVPIKISPETLLSQPAIVWPDDISLTRHPRVQASLAQLTVSESALLAEIRRQYPDLELGPLYGNEEGENRLGLGLGIRLPLWNRNRQGLAEAEGRRAHARLEALETWRTLVANLHETQAAWHTAHQTTQHLKDQALPTAQKTVAHTTRLFREGELDLLTLMSAETVCYQTQRSLREAEQAEADILIRASLLNPENSVTKANAQPASDEKE